MRKRGPLITKKSKHELTRSVPVLRDFSMGLLALAEEAPERMTMAQGVFFLYAGMRDLLGAPATFTELKETVGETVNRSLHTTYKVLVDEGRNRNGKREPGLGWLTRETDPADNRKKYLRLTAKGRNVLTTVMAALEPEGTAR